MSPSNIPSQLQLIEAWTAVKAQQQEVFIGGHITPISEVLLGAEFDGVCFACEGWVHMLDWDLNPHLSLSAILPRRVDDP